MPVTYTTEIFLRYYCLEDTLESHKLWRNNQQKKRENCLRNIIPLYSMNSWGTLLSCSVEHTLFGVDHDLKRENTILVVILPMFCICDIQCT